MTWSDIQSQASSFIGGGGNVFDDSQIISAIVNIGQMLTGVGFAVVMVGLLIIGIKYMMASPEEAAKLKGQLVGLSVSAVVIFGAWAIWSLVINIIKGAGI